MKKALLMALLAALGIAAVSCRDGKNKEGEEFNFRKSTWGMSRDQVRASEGGTPTDDKPEIIAYSGELQGMPVIIRYLFEGDKLVRAGYLFENTYEDPDSYISDYEKVKEYLIKEYGAPGEDNVIRDEGEESQDPDKLGASVCGGKLRYSAYWPKGGTVIKEILNGENGKCRHGVMFESVELYVNPLLKKNEGQNTPPAP